jgi:hypothetical protein
LKTKNLFTCATISYNLIGETQITELPIPLIKRDLKEFEIHGAKLQTEAYSRGI